ncbi:hypothetical protein MHYP_G00012730 [Metynnis hypsauchen]
MGNRNSAHSDDRDHLMDSKEKEMQDVPRFEELNLVIIGSHRAGKNEVANAILQKKAFRVWGTFGNNHIKNSGEIRNRKIKVIRAPGWSGDLHTDVDKQKQTKKQIVYSVQSHFEKGPHAVLLALDVNSTITDTTIKTLENLLTQELWDHTVVMFTHVEKLKDITIHDQIKVNQLQEFIESRCGKRYYTLKKKSTWRKQSSELVETIENFIASKDASVQFCLSDREGAETNDLKQKKCLIKRLKFTNTLSSNKTQDDSHQRMIDSKDAEMRKLEAALQKRGEEICKLQTKNAELQASLASSRYAEYEKNKDEQRHLQLEKESKAQDEKLTHSNIATNVQSQSTHRSKFSKLNSRDWLHQKQPSPCHSFEMQKLTSAKPSSSSSSSSDEGPHASKSHRGPHKNHSDFLRRWTCTLNRTMEELSEDQFKKMVYLLRSRAERRIPASQLDGRDRASVAELLVQTWGEHQCIINTRDIMKDIPPKEYLQDAIQECQKRKYKSITVLLDENDDPAQDERRRNDECCVGTAEVFSRALKRLQSLSMRKSTPETRSLKMILSLCTGIQFCVNLQLTIFSKQTWLQDKAKAAIEKHYVAFLPTDMLINPLLRTSNDQALAKIHQLQEKHRINVIIRDGTLTFNGLAVKTSVAREEAVELIKQAVNLKQLENKREMLQNIQWVINNEEVGPVKLRCENKYDVEVQYMCLQEPIEVTHHNKTFTVNVSDMTTTNKETSQVHPVLRTQGRGIYFYVDPSSAQRRCEADAQGQKVMFLGRVETGIFTVGRKGINTAPPVDPSNPAVL